ncbi:putative T7SS-secreted protein [Streptomyces massasporeus]|uniref:putative T7SS-secreted protein n=1 Tax=Streptomyces massasporeus TaxID=67324 RepID=UPI00340C21A0
MGLGDLVNGGLDKLEDGWEAGKKLVGEGVDKGTDLIGAGLEKVGAEGWADKARTSATSWPRSSVPRRVSSSRAERPGEQADHGNRGTIRASASHLKISARRSTRSGDGMLRLDSSHWKGEAADTFRRCPAPSSCSPDGGWSRATTTADGSAPPPAA